MKNMNSAFFSRLVWLPARHMLIFFPTGVIIFGLLSACSAGAVPSATSSPLPAITLTPRPSSTPTPELHRSLENGTFVAGENGACSNPCNEVTVINGGMDAVVVLEGMKKQSGASLQLPTGLPPVITQAVDESASYYPTGYISAVYVGANQRFTFSGFAGAFRICFAQGEDWDNELKIFTREASYACIHDILELPLPFQKYETVTVTLYPVEEGTTAIVPQTRDTFPLNQK